MCLVRAYTYTHIPHCRPRQTMAALNFCRGMLGTRITCDKVSADGYEAENLILTGLDSTGHKGFMTEAFVRPPVNLALHFAANINIDKVIICARVGMQRVEAVELFLNCTRVQCYSVGEFTIQAPHSQCLYTNAGSASSSDTQIFCFRNPHFQPRAPYAALVPASSRLGDQECVVTELRARPPADLEHVSHLSVRLTRTQGTCVPAVGWIEVWAQPATTCPHQLAAEIINAHKTLMDGGHSNLYRTCSPGSLFQPTSVELPSTTGKSKDQIVITRAPQYESIPEEFLDPLTAEVMSLPLLLPSGHTVDQRSLDRHNHSQAQWGRPPSDPYTGIAFTDTSKPLANSALKLRIDQFLLRHGDLPEVASAGRTIGLPQYQAGEPGVPRAVASRLISGTCDRTELVATSSKSMHTESAPTVAYVPQYTSTISSVAMPTKRGCPNGQHIQTHRDSISHGHKKQKVWPDGTKVIQNTAIINTGTSIAISCEKLSSNSSLTLANQPSDKKRETSNICVIDLTGDSQPISDQTCSTETPTIVVDLTKDDHTTRYTSSSRADAALEDALGGLPCFTQGFSSFKNSDLSTKMKTVASNATSNSVNTTICSNCAGSRPHYKSSCGHFFCRSCVVTANHQQIICKGCDTIINPKDLFKIHKI